MPQALAAVNDFVVKFANVNGSGSASANELFARSILRMGVPVSPRNIFPSNIQGLPTWYEVRVTEKSYLGRRGGVDMMVATVCRAFLAHGSPSELTAPDHQRVLQQTATLEVEDQGCGRLVGLQRRLLQRFLQVGSVAAVVVPVGVI